MTTGAGVGVGLGVGLAVGFGVGFAVGAGVAVAIGEVVGAAVAGAVVWVGAGVGVGPTATTGPLGPGCALPDGSLDAGTDDGSTDGGLELDGVWLSWPGEGELAVGSGLVPEAGTDGAGEVTAKPRSGVGATTPAVSATVARMRFSSPMATTRRAR